MRCIDQTKSIMKTTNTNTFGVIFYLKKYKINNGIAPIYARITVDGKRVDVSVKRSIEEKNWNGDKGMAKGNREEIRSLNTYLEQVRANIVACYQELVLQKKLITAELVKNNFLGNDNKEYTLSKVIEYHNTNMEHTLTWGTMKNYYTTQKYIQMFLKSRFNTSDIYLSELNYKFILDFEYFLRDHKPVDHHKPLANNGIMKHIERFRKMINMAIRMEWLEKDPFAAYQKKFEKVERGFLTKEELKSIETRHLPIERLESIRSLFVFSCYTGLSYIDVMQLKSENVIIGMDGEQWLFTNREKTNNPVKVPLLPEALEIIRRYKHHPRALAMGTLFPIISNQKLNSYLKEIADLCGIKKNLTFHLARHTFATTITLTNGVPIESVSKMLGHSSIKTTQIYAKVVEKKLSEDMQNLKARLNQAKEREPRSA